RRHGCRRRSADAAGHQWVRRPTTMTGLARGIAWCAMVAGAGIGLRALGQAPPPAAPTVQILSPGDNAYVSGPTLLRVPVAPPNLASTVVFCVDGGQVCALTTLPY